MKDFIVYLTVGIYLYGWYLIFFSQGYFDENGNEITRKQWKKLQQQYKFYH